MKLTCTTAVHHQYVLMCRVNLYGNDVIAPGFIVRNHTNE